MKAIAISGILAIIMLGTFSPSPAHAQNDDCKVLLESLSGQYDGDCKKGLAHGSGTARGADSYEGQFKKGLPDGNGKYTWSNGDVFEGTFNNGLKEGEGKITYSSDRFPDSIVTGIWKKDEYYGLYDKPFKVLSKTSPVNRIVVRKLGETPHDIMVRGEMDMLREKGLNSVYFTGDGFDNVQFPFTAEMEANYANVPFSFKFIIYEPGRWEVVLYFD